MKNHKLKFLVLFLVLAVQACEYHSEEDLYPGNDCDIIDVSYANQVVTILTNNGCIACHGSTSPSGGVTLDNYADVKIHVDNGRLLGSINHENGFKPMPQGQTSKIDQCAIDQITAWINDGARNN